MTNYEANFSNKKRPEHGDSEFARFSYLIQDKIQELIMRNPNGVSFVTSVVNEGELGDFVISANSTIGDPDQRMVNFSYAGVKGFVELSDRSLAPNDISLIDIQPDVMSIDWGEISVDAEASVAARMIAGRIHKLTTFPEADQVDEQWGDTLFISVLDQARDEDIPTFYKSDQTRYTKDGQTVRLVIDSDLRSMDDTYMPDDQKPVYYLAIDADDFSYYAELDSGSIKHSFIESEAVYIDQAAPLTEEQLASSPYQVRESETVIGYEIVNTLNPNAPAEVFTDRQTALAKAEQYYRQYMDNTDLTPDRQRRILQLLESCI